MVIADLFDFIDLEEEEEIWNVDENFIRVLFFIELIGLIFGVVEDGIVIDFFYLMFLEDLIEYIVIEINRYVRECIVAKLDSEWFDITFEEIKVFFGFYVLFGIK